MEKSALIWFAAICVAMIGQATAAPKIVALQCDKGRIEKVFGATKWLVYGCSDGKSLAFVAAKDSPAAPFTFTLAYTGNGYDLRGNGRGDRKATGAAYADLQKLTSEKVSQLLSETSAGKKR